ncbi:MAG: hypothetical protein ABI861_02405 [Panacibacter sp.]
MMAFTLVAYDSSDNTNTYNKDQISISSLKPWTFSPDSNYVLQNPDRYAWDLFRAINWPADTTLLIADTTLRLGDPGWVVWQTWKTAPEVYLSNGTAPKGWYDKDFTIRSSENFSQFSIKARLPDISKDPTFGLEEVVLNKSAFDYVESHQLYNINGQLAIYLSDSMIKFPKEAIELKVKWRKIPDTKYDKVRYHWQYVKTKNHGKITKELYGLVSIHITSKVLNNWFWATFEHIDSRSQKHPGDDGWLLPSKDRFACSEAPYDCERAPTGIGLEGTKWEYFLLRGTQTGYYNEDGQASLLANSNIERGFQLSSSCITCHALASVGPVIKDAMQRVDFLPASPLLKGDVIFGGKGYVGDPDTALFRLKDGRKMKQSDFVWSLSEANWYKPGLPLIQNKK